MKLWGGRFDKTMDETLEEFGASIHFDQVLWREDILGSLAHVAGLLKADVLKEEEALQLSQGLKAIEQKIASGSVQFNTEDEDIHMNIERLLFSEVGEVAGKVHTGRSRNDQVALDMRLYMRRQILLMIEHCCLLQNSLIHLANENLNVIIPGYTHLQRAQPVRLSHHFLAYVWMFFRDIERLQQTFHRTNKLPLGGGAVAGSSFPIDSAYVASLLNFDAVYQNSMDAVSDRDYLAEFLSCASLIMMHLSKLCEELIIWSSQEFAFIELDDAFCTGSSMMPQKKNPDCAELIRGKTGRVYGSLMALLTTLKGLPLAYNKDLQEDKEGIFDTVKTGNGSLLLMAKMMATIKINKEHINHSLQAGFLNATELANYLVKKGMTFRKAHETVGSIVKFCIQHDCTFSELNIAKMKSFSELFEEDVAELFSLEQAVEQQKNICGTAKDSVSAQIKAAEKSYEEVLHWNAATARKLDHLSFTASEDFVPGIGD